MVGGGEGDALVFTTGCEKRRKVLRDNKGRRCALAPLSPERSVHYHNHALTQHKRMRRHACAAMQTLHAHCYMPAAHRWQKPRISFALYIMSAAISMRRMVYMSAYIDLSSPRLVSTAAGGGSILCAL